MIHVELILIQLVDPVGKTILAVPGVGVTRTHVGACFQSSEKAKGFGSRPIDAVRVYFRGTGVSVRVGVNVVWVGEMTLAVHENVLCFVCRGGNYVCVCRVPWWLVVRTDFRLLRAFGPRSDYDRLLHRDHPPPSVE